MGALGNLIPLFVLFGVVLLLAYVGFQIYAYANELANRGKKKMEKKNVVFTKDGMKVGVKEVRDEDYTDKTQSVLVKTWNYGRETGSTGNQRDQAKRSRTPLSREGSSNSLRARSTNQRARSVTPSR